MGIPTNNLNVRVGLVWIIQEIILSSFTWGDSEIEWPWVGLAAAFIRIKISNLFNYWFVPRLFNAYFIIHEKYNLHAGVIKFLTSTHNDTTARGY
jgi:hypothetical protein